jgi:prophage DNA circulation protein
MSWGDGQLVRASFRGVEFDVLASQDGIERRIVEHEYLYRDGAELDDTGRKARPTRLTAVFTGRDYLAALTTFLGVCDEGATGPLRHPLLGTWQAKVASVQVQHEHTRRDYAAVEVEFREDGRDSRLAIVASVAAAQDTMTSQLDTLQTANDDLGDDAPTEVGEAITDATAYVTDVDDTEDDLTARYDQLARSVGLANDALDDVDAVDAWPARQGLRDVLLAARELKERLERIKPRALEQELAADAPLVTLAIRLYADPSRADDLLRMNKIRQPFLVPAGTTLRVHSA